MSHRATLGAARAACRLQAKARPLAREGWGEGPPPKPQIPDDVRALIEHELALIAELEYEPYFLTVHDIVDFARRSGILCQGRGSAANSAVCYALGITEVDPARMSMLFERFISRERNEPPDIDVDFEHQRREEVMQYVYGKYGRDRAALAATLITYRPKSAVRDVGKALGLDLAQVDRLTGVFAWWDGRRVDPARIREAGFDPDNPLIARLVMLTGDLMGFPRHLSQHVGGFVIARGLLERMVPVENAAMADRTVIQWDKDDLDAMGLLKVDCLALGMLSAIRRALDMVSRFRGRTLRMQDVPAEDPAVYAMCQRADTVGVFQIESRAQQSMLPRLKPACFYDLVIEVAIVRPGPIQGGMVHPYLRRRQGLEPVTYPSAAVKSVLERTLGVPIFQEQVMQLAIVAAGFSAGEADHLRRSMAAWRRKGGLEKFEQRLIDGMGARGLSESFARQIYQQILGFGEYGFPESHSASFSLLVYVSAWLKLHEPAAFCAALLNSQPMGFYAPAQLVQDARRHGVDVRGVDVTVSEWDCTLEKMGPGPIFPGGPSVQAVQESPHPTLLPAGRASAVPTHSLRIVGKPPRRGLPLPASGERVGVRGRMPRQLSASASGWSPGSRRTASRASSPRARSARSRTSPTSRTARGSTAAISRRSRRPARWPPSPATGTRRSGTSRAWRSCRPSSPARRSRKAAPPCPRPPRARTSSPTIARWASRSAAIRSRCCAGSWPRSASSPPPRSRARRTAASRAPPASSSAGSARTPRAASCSSRSRTKRARPT